MDSTENQVYVKKGVKISLNSLEKTWIAACENEGITENVHENKRAHEVEMAQFAGKREC